MGEKELEALRKKIDEVKKWRDDKLAEQEKTPLSEMPKLTVSMINSKIQDLDSEVQYLIQKAKMVKAEQERAKRKAEADAKKAKESNETDEIKEESETPTTEKPTAEEVIEDPSEKKPDSETVTDTGEEKPSDEGKEESGDSEHTEL